MIAIVCTLLICCAAITMFWLYLHYRQPNKDSIEPAQPHIEQWRRDGLYRALAQQSEPDKPESEPSEPEPVIPDLAQEYLEAAEKLIKEAQEQEMDGLWSVAEHTRSGAKKCREKAEKLIEEANGA